MSKNDRNLSEEEKNWSGKNIDDANQKLRDYLERAYERKQRKLEQTQKQASNGTKV